MRADLRLVERGLAVSRARAQELIASGRVSLNLAAGRQIIKKASVIVSEDVAGLLEVEPNADDFVSRGGLKMRGALAQLKFSPRDLRVLDVGISTGGFTDCLLQSGAERVVGVDVGHDQLAASLRNDKRVVLLEGVNARHLNEPAMHDRIRSLNDGREFDLIVIDVSFISLSLVLPAVIQYLFVSAPILALVKPQFEVGREGLGKNGIVKDATLYRGVETKIREACQAVGLKVEDYFESSIEGTDGNREFFVFARRS